MTRCSRNSNARWNRLRANPARIDRTNDVIETRLGQVKVLRYTGHWFGQTTWFCECERGHQSTRTSAQLRSGSTCVECRNMERRGELKGAA